MGLRPALPSSPSLHSSAYHIHTAQLPHGPTQARPMPQGLPEATPVPTACRTDGHRHTEQSTTRQ